MGVMVAGVLVALVIWHPGLTGRLVREDDVVEWLQVILALVALGFVAASARRRHLSALDVVLASLLIVLVLFEASLDRRLFGMPVIDGRFFARRTVPWPLHALAALVIAGFPLAVLVYAVRRWRELWRECRDGLRQGWLPLVVAGLALFAITQLWEKELNRVLPLPRYFLEETIELAGTLYLALGAWRRFRP